MSEVLSKGRRALAAALSWPVRLRTWWAQPTALLDSRLDSVDHGHNKSRDARRRSCRAALSPGTLLLRKVHRERVTMYDIVHGKWSFKEMQKHFYPNLSHSCTGART